MMKKLLTNKIASAASGECVIIGLKLTDAEAHALRFAGLFLFALSIIFLVHEWHHKAHNEVSDADPATKKSVRRHPGKSTRRRSRASHTN
jgi:hypothetical protein